MFGWEFPPYQAGGLATATLSLVKGLLQTGMQVTLVVPFPIDGRVLPELRLVSTAGLPVALRRVRVPSPLTAYGGVEEYAVGRAVARRRIPGTRGTTPYGVDLFHEIERFAAVASEIAQTEPHDVIDCHDWITYPAARCAREVSGRPLVAHIHATERDRSGDWANPEIRRREREGLRAADEIICNSQRMRRQVIESYEVDPARIHVVPWGLDERDEPEVPEPLPFPDDEPVVLFVGRVTRQKGPDYFIEMARRVADVVPSARFVIVGTGDMLPRIIERSVELDLANRVHFTGGLSGPDVDRAFRIATVCVMSSVSEPFGLVALESLRSGTPVILPRDAGVAEVVRNAFRTDFWDVERMADQVVGVIRYRELHRELRERGLREVTQPRFGLAEPARRTAAVYHQALVGAPRSH
jgi:glycosyltransferase involved in cell wall biosynthesis